MMKEKVVVLTGAGISAESGIATFRGSGGLWEGVDVMEVASVEGWLENPQKVLNFYNLRRKQLKDAQPNDGHKALVRLENFYDVTIITQNVDNLHERAGSQNVIHLHGELTKARPDGSDGPIWDIGYSEIDYGQCDEKGRQLRPHIVWFGEMVPMMEVAASHVARADIVMIIGTSLAVYPAAGLVDLAPYGVPVYVIDPQKPSYHFQSNIKFIQEGAVAGTPKVVEQLIKSTEKE